MDLVPSYDQLGVSPAPNWVNANPSAGIPGSIVNATIFNAVQQEIVNTITGAGLTPNANSYTQLLAAIEALIPASAPSSALIHVGSCAGTNTYTTTLSPAVSTLTDGMIAEVTFANANTAAAPTFNPNGIGAETIVRNDGTPCQIGDLQPGQKTLLSYNLATTSWQILGLISSNLPNLTPLTTSGTFTVPAGITRLFVQCWGAGGGGGGTVSTSAAGGGGGGGYVQGYLTVTPGQQISYVVGSGGTAGSAGNNAGGGGGSTSFGNYLTATGGTGSAGSSGGTPNGNAGNGGTGSASGSSFNVPGADGQNGIQYGSGNNAYGGGGGGASYSSSGSWCGTLGAGGVGNFPGGGGEGGSSNGTTGYGSGPNPGGAGANGLIIVQY